MKKVILFFVSAVYLIANQIAAGYSGTSEFEIVKKSMINTTFSIVETKGDIENLRKIFKSPDVTLSVVQDDIVDDLVRKNTKIKSKLKIVAPLYPAAMLLIVPKSSSIQTFKDLASKRVIVDVVGSGDYYTFLKLLEKYLINPEIFNMKKDQALDYLKRNKADAYFFIGDIKDIAPLQSSYKFIPITSYLSHFKSFSIDKKHSISTSYVVKYLITDKSKDKKYSKQDMHIFLDNLLDLVDKDFLCNFNINTPVEKEDFIYFACSEHIKKRGNKKTKSNSKNVRRIKKALYYDNLEDITIYPQALRDKNFDNYGTTYIMEKVKFDNVIKLMKKELADDDQARFTIISKGPEDIAMSNEEFIYRKLKRKKIPRDAIMEKVVPIKCSGEECFYNTTITFKIF